MSHHCTEPRFCRSRFYLRPHATSDAHSQAEPAPTARHMYHHCTEPRFCRSRFYLRPDTPTAMPNRRQSLLLQQGTRPPQRGAPRFCRSRFYLRPHASSEPNRRQSLLLHKGACLCSLSGADLPYTCSNRSRSLWISSRVCAAASNSRSRAYASIFSSSWRIRLVISLGDRSSFS